MRTEELKRTDPPRDPRGVSPALRDPLPVELAVIDRHGRGARLCAAGYVLFFGRTYRLRVAGTDDGALPPEPRWVRYPDFLEAVDGPAEEVKHGRPNRCLSFRAKRSKSWWRYLVSLTEVHTGDLEIEYGPGGPTLVVPIVTRTPWTMGLVTLLIVGGLAGWAGEQLYGLLRDWFVRGALPWDEGETWWSALPSNPRFWFWPIVTAVVSAVGTVALQIDALWHRSRELERRFHDRFGG